MNTHTETTPTIEELLKQSRIEPKPQYSETLQKHTREMGEQSRNMGRWDRDNVRTEGDLECYGLDYKVWKRYQRQLELEGFADVPAVTALYFRCCYDEGRQPAERVSIIETFLSPIQYEGDAQPDPCEITFYDMMLVLDGKGYNARFLIHTADETHTGPRETQLLELKPDDGERSSDVDEWFAWGLDGDLGEELHEKVLEHYLEEENSQ